MEEHRTWRSSTVLCSWWLPPFPLSISSPSILYQASKLSPYKVPLIPTRFVSGTFSLSYSWQRWEKDRVYSFVQVPDCGATYKFRHEIKIFSPESSLKLTHFTAEKDGENA